MPLNETITGELMRKKHLVNLNDPTTPFCAARIDMIRKGFDITEVKEEVTCRLCLMRMGVIEDTRGNWDNRTR